jgi:hypothetical protein|tara:strand:- start:221 stop:442 length:222 start_codon:yes stop_codon:yes gene_type:complete
MNNFIILLFATTMEGSVDQVHLGKATVEISARDGHSHTAEFPTWLFPCEVKEGLQFYIHTGKNSTTIRCRKNK